MDKAMNEHGNSARLSAGDEADNIGDQPGAPAAPAAQGVLTHRPRGLAHLNANLNAAAPAASAASAPMARDLRPFADQLIAIAEQLRTASPSDAAASRPAHGAPVLASSNPAPEHAPESLAQTHTQAGIHPRVRYAEMARISYARRRKRATIFGDPELFGEPAWDILLDLYIAQAEEKPVSVSSACIGSAAPPTTGLRWLGVLADHGLVEREHDPLDQRRVLVRLTPKALDAMDDYFANSLALTADRRRKQG